MKFFDFFAGIGGFRLGLEMAGHECVGHCEVDKFANMSYNAMHQPKETEVFFNDIRTIDPRDIPECDIFCGGFPCQSFSIAGLRRGFEDTRGTLFFEIMRIVRERHPRIVFLENVRGLLNHEGGDTFETIITTLAELGYGVEWEVLNSKYFGVPQNRERVFIVGHLGGIRGKEIFPLERKNESNNIVKCVNTKRSDGTEPYQQDRVYSTEGLSPALMQGKSDLNIIQVGNIVDDSNIGFKNPQRGRVYSPKGISPALNTVPGGGLEPKILTEINGGMIRKLTPKECFRLQGFPDEYYERAAKINSDRQLYKQIGNSVTVNVIYEIARRFE